MDGRMSICLTPGTNSYIENVLQSEGLLLTQNSEKLEEDDLKHNSMCSVFVKNEQELFFHYTHLTWRISSPIS